jgi:hypothetical protein
MIATFRQVKDSRIPISLNLTPEDPRVADYVNEATLRLVNRAKDGWWDQCRRMRFCLTNSGCITWPRYVGEIRGMSVCEMSLTHASPWADFVDDGSGLADFNSCTCLPGIRDDGYAATFDDIIPNSSGVFNKSLKVYLEDPTDAGKVILFQGRDQNGKIIKTKEGSTYYDGFNVALVNQSVTSTQKLSAIDHVQKPLTNGRVLVYEIDNDTGVERAIAVYEPDETTPWYRRSYLRGTGTSCNRRVVTVMAKLAYYPVRRDTDWLVVGNLAAVKDMCMSVRKKEGDLSQEADQYELSAIRELNQELRAHGMKSSVRVHVHGSAPFWPGGRKVI